MTHFGSQSMIAPLRWVLVRRPDEAFGTAEPKAWHYTARPKLQAAQEEHDAFVELLRQADAKISYHDAPLPGCADAIYVYDPALVTDGGAIILQMGKDLRRGEEPAMARCLRDLGIPTYHTLQGDARAEGGDLLWLDSDTLAVGLGFRTNRAGVQQLQEALSGLGIRVLPVHLPFHAGPEACLHLLSLISIVAERLAVVYPPLLPVPFWQMLQDWGFHLIAVPDREFETMGTNVLALAPGRCVMLEGNPVTQRRLEAAGCQVQTYKGHEISLKAEGGPTCLTRPLLRGTC